MKKFLQSTVRFEQESFVVPVVVKQAETPTDHGLIGRERWVECQNYCCKNKRLLAYGNNAQEMSAEVMKLAAAAVGWSSDPDRCQEHNWRNFKKPFKSRLKRTVKDCKNPTPQKEI